MRAAQRYPRGGGRAHTGAQSDEARWGEVNSVSMPTTIAPGVAGATIAGADTPAPLQSLHSCLQP